MQLVRKFMGREESEGGGGGGDLSLPKPEPQPSFAWQRPVRTISLERTLPAEKRRDSSDSRLCGCPGSSTTSSSSSSSVAATIITTTTSVATRGSANSRSACTPGRAAAWQANTPGIMFRLRGRRPCVRACRRLGRRPPSDPVSQSERAHFHWEHTHVYVTLHT